VPLFIVTKKEIWRQRVLVEAEDANEARYKAEKGESEIHEDPQYEDDLLDRLWAVEEIEDHTA
jgi:hypothetical protein